MMTYYEAARDLTCGMTVVLNQPVERFPEFIVPSGTRLIVRENNLNEMCPALILFVPVEERERTGLGDRLADWDDCLWIYDPESEGFAVDDDSDGDTGPAENPNHSWHRVTIPVEPVRLPRSQLVSVDGSEAITWGVFLALNADLSAEEIDAIEAALLAEGVSFIGGGASGEQQICLT